MKRRRDLSGSDQPAGRAAAPLLLFESVEAWQELVPVDDVGVEFRSVDAACLRTSLPSMLTGTMQAPHMPVASTMIELTLAVVRTP